MTASVLARARLRRLIGAVLAALLFATLAPTMSATTAWAASIYESEPNNSREKADVLSVGDTVTGSALGTGNGDEDFYAVDLPKAGRVTLNLKFPANLGTSNAYDVNVYNATGKQLYSWYLNASQYDGSWLAAQGTFSDAGRIYVRIWGHKSWVTWGKTYALNVGLNPGTVETEPNNDTATADALALGTTTSGSALGTGNGDEDFYAVDLPKAGRVTLNLKFPANLGTSNAYDVNVYNATGKQLYSWYLKATHANALMASLPAGRAYVRVWGHKSWVTWGKTYTLNISQPPSTLTATPTPTVTGTAKVGSTLTAKAGVWAPAPVSLAYQWLRDGKAIAGATKSTYTLVGADAKKKVSVRVTGSKAGYTTVVKTSTAKTIALGTLTATPKPKIAGTASVGKVLTAKPGTWKPAPVTLKYQWLRNGKAITKATGQFYVLLKADKGKRISVKITGSKVGYKTVAKTSAAKTIK